MIEQDTRSRIADWFRQWRSPLRKFLQGKHSVGRADLEDVSQEVFFRLLRYDHVELVQHPQAYLFKMASNVATEWALRARSRHPHDSEWLNDLLSEDEPQDSVQREASIQEVKRAIGTLPARNREILKLLYGEGLGYNDIAARIGSTPRVVKRCIVKSYEKLRVELQDQRSGEASHGR